MADYADARRIALALPEVEEVEVPEWGHPTLRVRGKMFASGAPDSPAMSVKASKEEQAELVGSRPEVFSVAAYVGRYGWVRVQLPGIDVEELAELLVEAWRRTAPRRLVTAYDSAGR
ncbi:MmcQ/YjbR family DNA-binding protein [Planosporangium sp. 12N6]|uniref:MmcQ/YjbR family DNA-binding protein n=1 Tax=Planosporangium spinosum TaxID=3402278 RepID=UPI003CF2959C